MDYYFFKQQLSWVGETQYLADKPQHWFKFWISLFIQLQTKYVFFYKISLNHGSCWFLLTATRDISWALPCCVQSTLIFRAFLHGFAIYISHLLYIHIYIICTHTQTTRRSWCLSEGTLCRRHEGLTSTCSGFIFDLGGHIFLTMLSAQSPPSPTKVDQRISFHTSLISLQTKPPHTFYASFPLTLLQFATFSPTVCQC